MYDIIERYADKRVDGWPLMSNLWIPLGIVIFYLYVILKAGPRYMQNRKPYNLKTTLQVYNLFQVVSCAALIYGITASSEWTVHNGMFKCIPADFSDNPLAVRSVKLVWWTMMLKLVELIETVFFVMRKKYDQVSTLHLYHHSSTFLLGWVGTKFYGGGMTSLYIIINSFIHVLMYSYYFMSTLGPEWQKKLNPWKPKLTILQMIQFCIILAHASLALRDDCPVPKLLPYIFIPNVLIVFYFFYNFFVNTYLKKSKKQ